MAKKISSKDLFDKEDIFEGIRLSAKQTIDELNKLDAEFKQLATVMQSTLKGATTNTTQGIGNFVQTTQKANSLMAESINITKMKAQAEQQLQKAEQEAAKAAQQKSKAELEALRVQQQAAKETERLAKASEKAERQAANEGNAYKQLEKQARDLKNESKRLGAELLALDQAGQRNTQEYRELAAQYEQTTLEASQMDKQLKSLDYTVGDHQRNVGNYTSATGNLKKELRALTMELMNMDEADPRFQEMAARAGQLKDQIADTQAVVKATAGSAVENFGMAFARAGEIAARAVQGVVAGMQLLGIEDPDTMKNIQRLQAIGSLADSMKGLGGLKDALTEIRTGLTAAAVKSGILVQVKQADVVATTEQTVATTAQTGAIVANTVAQETNIAVGASGNAIDEAGVLLTEAQTIATAQGTAATVADTVADEAAAVAQVASTAATEGATAATYAFNTALLANPAVLVTAAVVALGAALYYAFGQEKKLTAAEAEAAKVAEERAKIQQELNGKLIEERSGFMFLIEALRKTNAGSKERSSLITEINKKYGTTLTNMSNELAFQKQLNVAAEQWLVTQEAKYRMMANEKEFLNLMKKEASEQAFISAQYTQLGFTQADLDAQAEVRQKMLKKGYKATVEDIAILNKKSKFMERAARGEISEAEKQSLRQQEASAYKMIEFHQSRIEAINQEKKALAGAAVKNQSVISQSSNSYFNSNAKVATSNATVAASTSEVTTSFAELNQQMARAVELMQTLAEQRQAKELQAQQEAIDYALTEEIKRIEAGGDAQVDALEKVVFERFEMERKFAEERLAYDLEQIRVNYEAGKAVRQKALDDEKKQLEDAAKKEIKDKKTLTTKLTEINTNYQVRQSELNKEEAKLYNDMVLDRMVKEGEYAAKRVQITEAEGAEINRVNDAVYDAQKQRAESMQNTQEETSKKEIENLKKTENEKRAIIKLTADYLDKASQKRVQQIDEEIKAAEKQYEVLAGLAQDGNITAQQSLAEQQRIIDEANMKKERELKRQQRIKLAESVYSTYSAKVEAGSKNPLLETIRDTTLLAQFIQSIPTFMDGTEDTGINGKGVDGKGGFHAILHPNERVIPKSLNQKIGALSNEELAKVAHEYQYGKAMEGASQTASALDLSLLINEIKDLKGIIKDKPETSVALGEITQSVVEIVEKRVRGNNTVFNRFKVRR